MRHIELQLQVEKITMSKEAYDAIIGNVVKKKVQFYKQP